MPYLVRIFLDMGRAWFFSIKLRKTRKFRLTGTRDYYTTTEAAKHLAVSPDTVLKWVKAGKIASYRTPGGHARIPRQAIDSLLPGGLSVQPSGTDVVPRYCWDFHTEQGVIDRECLNCIAYRSRAMRCYEMRDIPEEFGHLKLHCQPDCSQCEYFRLMHGRGTSALVFTGSWRLIESLKARATESELVSRFATS